MNQVNILGRLARDPEFKMTAAGKAVAQVTVAVNRPFKNTDGKQEADFIPCIFWGKNAEIVNQYFRKGNPILLTGRLQTRTYTDKNNVTRWVTEIIAERIEFLPAAKQSEPGQQGYNQPVAPQSNGSFVPFDEEIPF